MVEGRQYYFHFKSNRWLPADQQSHPSNTTPAALTTSNQQAERHLIISNLTNQFQDALSAFSASIGESS
jgi:hypothetical protein